VINSDKYFIHPSAIVESPNIGVNTRIWGFSHIMEGVIIGENCNVGEHCFLESGVCVGNNVVIKNGISIWNGVKIEDGAFLGPHVVFTNDLHPRSGYPKPMSKTKIGTGATIGAGAVILSDIEIGEFSMVGAGAVVTKSVKPQNLVYGNPAKVQGWVCKCGLKLKDESSILCTCSRKYYISEDGVLIEQ
jgi:acetyltransferase-like isoleucine patch superfamily enzyme|tara:strand:- start:82 stop:648 length:567 start_codon:yes stop_codon:yes gene_type:complete